MKKGMKPADDEPIGRAIMNELLLREAFSPEKAVPGPELRAVINRARASLQDPSEVQEIDDRAFRAIYCRLPICSGDSGLYIPTKPEHVRAFENYLKKKALGEFRRIRYVQERRPELGPYRNQIVIDFDEDADEAPPEPGSKACRTCAGSGKLRLGDAAEATCPTCRGAGW